ncbi:hypothetical protein P4O66_003461 [Electrophorus voltai]|uniref:Reverse transcriptase domain-containing protein n=1 Tax=Electrophorus voltai TaxID=2609070 RepID=A0AAD9DLG9_9TELE|nr:hypothetical protein P4O66_003461 [Electrophorus voltai]
MGDSVLLSEKSNVRLRHRDKVQAYITDQRGLLSLYGYRLDKLGGVRRADATRSQMDLPKQMMPGAHALPLLKHLASVSPQERRRHTLPAGELRPLEPQDAVSVFEIEKEDALNDFYARFEAQNNVAAEKSIPPQNDQVLCLTAADLADVLTDIFNICLSCAVVPTCFKTTTIVPVPKKPTVSCFNDHRPFALTSIIMNCFERLVMRHIKTQFPPSLDPLQFAYHSNRSTDDAVSTTLHLALTHLDKKGTYMRMLFIDSVQHSTPSFLSI